MCPFTRTIKSLNAMKSDGDVSCKANNKMSLDVYAYNPWHFNLHWEIGPTSFSLQPPKVLWAQKICIVQFINYAYVKLPVCGNFCILCFPFQLQPPDSCQLPFGHFLMCHLHSLLTSAFGCKIIILNLFLNWTILSYNATCPL